MSDTLLLLLSGNGPATVDCVRRLPPTGATAAWVACRLPHDPLAGMGFSERAFFDAAVGFDAVPPAGPDLDAAVETILDACEPNINRGRSTAVAGTTHVLMEGRSEVVLVFAIHRLEKLTHEAYSEHWRDRHGPLARELVDTTGYEQLHADLSASHELCVRHGLRSSELDGVAVCYFESEESFADMLKARSSHPGVNPIYEDELRFLDHERSMGQVMGATHLG